MSAIALERYASGLSCAERVFVIVFKRKLTNTLKMIKADKKNTCHRDMSLKSIFSLVYGIKKVFNNQ